jgi:hypothetical protein
MSPEGLNTMPADPSPLLAALTQQYDVAVQFNVQNLPEAMRQQATAGFAAAQQGMTKLPNESDADFEARKLALQSQLETTTQMMRELDQVKLGLTISSEEQKVYLDLNFLALPGTPLAQEMAAGADATTNFAGFVNPDAAASLSFAGKVTGTNAAQMEQMIAQVRAKVSESIDAEAKPEAREAIRSALGEILDAILATVKAGTVDGGAVVLASPEAPMRSPAPARMKCRPLPGARRLTATSPSIRCRFRSKMTRPRSCSAINWIWSSASAASRRMWRGDATQPTRSSK